MKYDLRQLERALLVTEYGHIIRQDRTVEKLVQTRKLYLEDRLLSKLRTIPCSAWNSKRNKNGEIKYKGIIYLLEVNGYHKKECKVFLKFSACGLKRVYITKQIERRDRQYIIDKIRTVLYGINTKLLNFQ